ncbi:MAG: vanadium-dependent haloperoxidase [Saprospiraceae bacterium]|nr:vanadium-dependent haloperoxidase [Saprospiraceae bacterium]
MKNFKLAKSFLALMIVGGMLFMHACSDVKVEVEAPANAHKYDKTVFLDWNNAFLQIERYAPGYRPGPAPRALAYLGLSAYEAVISAIPENNSLASLYSGLEIPKADPNLEYHWPAVVNASYEYLMERFFYHMENTHPGEFGLIQQTYNRLHNQYASETSDEVLARSEEFGKSVAAAVYAWESLDTPGHNAFLNALPVSYNPPSGVGKWQPTFPDYGKAMFPYWGEVRRFAMKDADIVARPPIPYSENENSLYYTQGLEVYNTVQNIKANGPGGYEGRWMGEFWSDDMVDVTFSPPSRLIAILNQVVDKENLDLAECAEAYAKMGMAISDNGVAIWHSKYYYNIERPVDFIRRVMPAQYPDAANWSSILNHPYGGPQGFTPSFPAYPSGHSGFGGAGAKILSALFEFTPEHPGTYTFTDLCHINRTEFIGTPRTFASFRDLGAEDAYSRIPLGVHWRMDCDEGLRMGELAAQRVLELPWKK